MFIFATPRRAAMWEKGGRRSGRFFCRAFLNALAARVAAGLGGVHFPRCFSRTEFE
jgi:hypothetical protein